MTNHTPLPWKADLNVEAAGVPILHNGNLVASCFGKPEPESKANAQLIVCAVNNHQLLRDALKACEKELDTWHNWQLAANPAYPKSKGCKTVLDIILQARQALNQTKL